ncbi:serine/arginine repetitive matrix protein 1 isoform X2 [Orussus abietinus]|uniref:serine/arginine repetitive matrix protein 1 isoform X2 n=1 Tax=Orussus abietinus TaxID=222816 RepID=UPI0006262B08|nr:serine/arginine repetitive matrix protein 1 isoform X2 [Orussus abietinus]
MLPLSPQVHTKNLRSFPVYEPRNMDYRQKMVVPGPDRYKQEEDDEEDLEALRLAALRSLRAKDTLRNKQQIRPLPQSHLRPITRVPCTHQRNQQFHPRGYYQNTLHWQNGNLYYQSPGNPNLIAIIPVDESISRCQPEPPPSPQKVDEVKSEEVSKFYRYEDNISSDEDETRYNNKEEVREVKETIKSETMEKEATDAEVDVPMDKEHESDIEEGLAQIEENEEETECEKDDDDDVLLMADLEEEDSLERLMDEMEREMNVDKSTGKSETKSTKSSGESKRTRVTTKSDTRKTNSEQFSVRNKSSSPTVPLDPTRSPGKKAERRSVSPRGVSRSIRKRRSLSPKAKLRKKSPRRSPKRSPPRHSRKVLKESTRHRSPRRSPLGSGVPRSSPGSPLASRSPSRRSRPRSPGAPWNRSPASAPSQQRSSPWSASPGSASPASPTRRRPPRSPGWSPRDRDRDGRPEAPRTQRERRSLSPERAGSAPSAPASQAAQPSSSVSAGPASRRKEDEPTSREHPSSDPVLEARRRKFESARPIDPLLANKKIKLSKRESTTVPVVPSEATEPSSAPRNPSKVRTKVKAAAKATGSEKVLDRDASSLPGQDGAPEDEAGPVDVEPVRSAKERTSKKKKKKDKELYQAVRPKHELPLSERIGKEKKCRKRKEPAASTTPEDVELSEEADVTFENETTSATLEASADSTVDEDGDLRAELSRRRAERLNRAVPIQSARLLQSAFKGVVNEVVKNNAKANRRHPAKTEEKTNQKEARRVTVLHRPASELHDSEDETVLDPKLPIRFRLGINKTVQDTRESKASRKAAKRQGRKKTEGPGRNLI